MIEMTRKDTRNLASSLCKPLIRLGYCDLQRLVAKGDCIASNFGIYGWNWSLYSFDSCLVCTGYRNLTGEALTTAQYEKAEKLINSFEFIDKEKAEEIWESILN